MFIHDENDEQLHAMRQLPKFRRFTHAFITKVGPDAGKARIGNDNHIDMWFYSSFDALSAVIEVKNF